MGPHPQTFSFVDRISSILDNGSVRGQYRIPDGADFPLALVGEAVGQLAAWSAMATLRFESRPVAGLAGSVELFSPPRPGQVLELAADLEEVDAERVAYAGTAHANGALVIRLRDCVGPMVPLADYDDPARLRARFQALCRGSVAPGGFSPLPPLPLERTGGEPGRTILARFTIPAQAPFFADHFPRRPVFPGSLLMHLNLELGTALAAELFAPNVTPWSAVTLRNMKLRSFLAPGSTLQIAAAVRHHTPASAELALDTRLQDSVVATATLALAAQEAP